MTVPRTELHDLVEQVPDDQVEVVVAELRAMIARGVATWPPAWFGAAEGSPGASERSEQVLRNGFGESRS